MPHRNPKHLARELKGAPLAILWVLLWSLGEPLRQEALERDTGYTDKPVSQALALLIERGLIVKSQSGFTLAEAEQLHLPWLSTSYPQDYPQSSESRRISDSATAAPSASPAPSYCSSSSSSKQESEKFRLELQALALYGISPTRKVLATLEAHQVTVDQIHFHAARLKAENRYSTGLLLTCMADPIPASQQPDNSAASRSKYTEGPYAEFIKH